MANEKVNLTRTPYWHYIIWCVAFIALYFGSRYNYLLFHSLAELFSIIIALCISAIAWNSRRLLKNDYLAFLGVAFLFVGIIDIAHTLAYKGMGVFSGYDATNLGAQLWISARYIEALSLAAAPLFLSRKLRAKTMLLIYLVVTALLLTSIFYWRNFPICFIQGAGLTPFKVISEYVISFILLCGIGVMVRKRGEFGGGIVKLMIAAMAVTICSEMSFTLYTDAYGVANMAGHFLKIVAFYFVYKALIETGLSRPYDLLFRNLKRSEENITRQADELAQANARLLQEAADRQKAETLAQDTLQHYSTLFGAMNEGVCIHQVIYDNSGKAVDYLITDINPSYEAITGLSRDKAIGMKASDLYGTGSPPYIEVYARVAESGKPDSFDTYFPPMNKYFNISVFSPERGKFATVFTDITQRKTSEKLITEAKEAAESSKNRLETMLRTVPVGVFIVEKPGQFTYVNDAAKVIYGFDPTILGFEKLPTVVRFLRPDGSLIKQEERAFVRALKGETVINEELIIERQDGKRITVLVSVSPMHGKDGEVVAAIGAFRDIEERKQAEEALRKAHDELDARVRERTLELSEANRVLETEIVERKRAEESGEAERKRFFEVLEMLPVYVVLLSPDYHVPFANRFFRERFGESNGKRCYEYLFNRTEPCEICETYKVLKTKGPLDWEWTGPDGHNYDIHDFPFTDTDGSNLIMEVGIDITAMKQAQAALQKAKDELEVRVHERTKELKGTNEALNAEVIERKQAEKGLQSKTDELARSNAELEQFAYVASHDLQEPLRMVSSYVQLLAKRYKGKLDADADDFINFAQDGSLRMQKLINDLLAYSRVSTRGKPPEKMSLETSLKHALDNLKITVKETGAVITHDPLPVVYGDEAQFTQIFQNLIDNAIKFRGDAAPAVHIFVEQGDNEVICSVRDNGIGIAPEYVTKLFLLFQRLHTRKEYPGTGIGLAVCKRIVERHGGRIWVESKPGEGSNFRFSIPFKKE